MNNTAIGDETVEQTKNNDNSLPNDSGVQGKKHGIHLFDFDYQSSNPIFYYYQRCKLKI